MSRTALFSSTTKKVIGPTGMRRSRPKISSDTLVSLIDRLQKEEGKHLDMRFGATMQLSATLADQEVCRERTPGKLHQGCGSLRHRQEVFMLEELVPLFTTGWLPRRDN
jgi:hypothetical protein